MLESEQKVYDAQNLNKSNWTPFSERYAKSKQAAWETKEYIEVLQKIKLETAGAIDETQRVLKELYSDVRSNPYLY